MLSRRALTILNAMPEHDRFIRGIVSWIGLRQVSVRFAREPRTGTALVFEMRRVQPRSRQRGGKPTIAGETNKANRTIATVF